MVMPAGGPIRPTLLRCREERFSGLIHIDGGPGGSVCFRDGLIIAAVTPAAPGPESLLLKSGRVAETDWIQAYDAAAASGRLADELVRRGLIGGVALEVVCLSAVFDAAFAMAMYGADVGRTEPDEPDRLPPSLPLVPGVEPDRLIREASRRVRASAEWRRLGVSVNSRPLPVSPPAGTSEDGDTGRRDILLNANGRRTPRDIAFAVGRGLFVVMGEIARMVAEGLLDGGAPGPVNAEPSARTETRGVTDGGAEQLPQRRRGASKINEVLPMPPVTRKPLLHRLRAVRPILAMHEDGAGPAEESE